MPSPRSKSGSVSVWDFYVLFFRLVIVTHWIKLTAVVLVLFCLGGFRLLLVVVGVGAAATGFAVHKFSQNLIKHRQEAFPEAQNEFQKRLESKRVIRKERYDLYLPTSGISKTTKIGLIFLPGALVDSVAYAVLASQLSDQGILVAILNLEPHRLAMTVTKAALMAILQDENSIIHKWAIGGHSMGAKRAYDLCATTNLFAKLVLCGGVLPRNCPPLPPNVAALQVVGSEDQLFWSQHKKGVYQGLPGHKYVEIAGGNHSGVGHYGPQTYPICDGERTIALEEQQRILAEETAEFLLDE
mmetsp:Transcript_18338/g.27710  ORF Transcript_18338/g.27710 Transcript_18338/m.27710 type:complete len:299 (-) Transcript_18338:1108-2004(-)|eukprot:CAMPEP_0178924078 /NCGR_PEP_ID=MMETSP0786-20121207/17119_1 /TAXON_ID=186022 /ORGANISM="Thalassionema frauenfeldii, Strain CCMP 1798" /LENGTH=298 /DNA_ID=CAMNT_0020598733 /DNA_START=57 /DNA_END=953 /DNA_ORIENTATION=+